MEKGRVELEQKKATANVLLAGVLWGIISIFVRGLSAAGLSSLQITEVRMIVGALGMALVLLIRAPEKFKIHPKDLWMFFGTGVVSVVFFNVCYFTAMQRSEVSIAVVLLYTSPMFVMLMSVLFFREKITPLKLLALAMTMAGSVCVAGLVGGSYHLSWLVLLLGLGSGFFYATYSIFGQVALKKYDTMTVTFYTFLVAALCALPFSGIGAIVTTAAASPLNLGCCLGIGVFCTILPYLFYSSGLGHMEASRAAILATVEPLVGALLGMIAYRETVSGVKLLGIALIFGAVVVLNLKPRRIKAAA